MTRSHIKLKYDAVFLPVPVPGIGFDHHTAHPPIELHGVFIVRVAFAGKTVEPIFSAVIL